MDMNNLMTTIATGFGLGISTLLFSTLTYIPASFVMNKFIYHAPAMRVILGIIAGAFSILSFIVILVMRCSSMEKVHYFGLFPTWMQTTDSEPTGWSAFFFKFLALFTHPFMMFFLDDDREPFKKMLEPLLVPADAPFEMKTIPGQTEQVKVYKGAVNEAFSRAVRYAGSIENDGKWGTEMESLQPAGQFIFTPAREVSVDSSASGSGGATVGSGSVSGGP